MDAHTAFAAARLRAATDRPYLSSALWALIPVVKPGVPTMACDKYWRVYYDPDVITTWPLDQAAGAVYHEVSHLLREHAERMEAYPWPTDLLPEVVQIINNLATDAEENDDLLAEGVKFPVDPVTPASLGKMVGKTVDKGQLAEVYVQILLDNLPAQAGGKCAGKGLGASGMAKGVGGGKCGSCSHGGQDPWEEPAPGDKAGKDAAPGIGKAEGELIRRQVAREIQEASKTQGNIPGGWRRWADAKLKPQVDWRKQLRSMVRAAAYEVMGAADYSYRRPARRQDVAPRVVLPSLRQPVPSIAFVIDTSGSMANEQVAQGIVEVGGALKGLGLRDGVHVLAVDAAVHSCKRVFDARQIQPLGGGGTDMTLGIQRAMAIRPKPQVVVVLTDGYTGWPAQRPAGTRVVVGMIGTKEKAPDWARVLHIPVHGKAAA